MTIVDQFESTATVSRPSESSPQDPPESDDVDSHILRLVEEDPFMTIGEIKHDLSRLLPERKTGWWRIFSTLRRRKLLTRRSRFAHARGRR